MPQRAMRGWWTVQVAAETPEEAHTWKRRTSAMSPVRYYGGGPHRAVQNQAFCRTGRPRRTVRYRKRPCGVREVHLSAGAERGGGSSAGATESWAIGGWWLRDWAAGGREVSNNEQNNDLPSLVLPTDRVLFCLIVRVLSATAETARNYVSTQKGQPCCEW